MSSASINDAFFSINVAAAKNKNNEEVEVGTSRAHAQEATVAMDGFHLCRLRFCTFEERE